MSCLRVRGMHRRQLEVEDGAARWRPAIPHLPAHRIDDAVAHRQPEAGALPDRLRREERLKQLGFVIRRDAGTGVLDLEKDALAFVARSDSDATRRPARAED